MVKCTVRYFQILLKKAISGKKKRGQGLRKGVKGEKRQLNRAEAISEVIVYINSKRKA